MKVGRPKLLGATAVLAATVAAALFLLAAAPTGAVDRLEVLNGPITAKTEGLHSSVLTALVIVRNPGDKAAVLSFSAHSGDANKVLKVEVVGGSATIEAHSIGQVTLAFPDDDLKEGTGYLMVAASGYETAYAALNLYLFMLLLPRWITPPSLVWIIAPALFISLVVLVICLLIIRYGVGGGGLHLSEIFRRSMTGMRWKFDENWASTLVAVGGILATLASSKILPDNPVLLGKYGFQILNIAFPVFIALAPFLSSVFNSFSKVSKEVDAEGRVRMLVLPFLIGAWMVVWAVVGELMTIAVMFEEMYGAGHLSKNLACTSLAVVVLLCILGAIYSGIRIVRTCWAAQTLDGARETAIAVREGAEIYRPVYLP